MEGLSVKLMKGLRGYWRRHRGYERLDGSGRRRKARVEVLGAGRTRRRPRFLRIRVARRIRLLRGFSPKKMLVRLRDAYVNMMLALADSGMASSGYGGAVGKGHGAAYGLRGPAVKEYDEKMIVQIYKMMIAQPAPITGTGIC